MTFILYSPQGSPFCLLESSLSKIAEVVQCDTMII